MKDDFDFKMSELRGMRQFELDSIANDKENILDGPIDKLVVEIKNQIAQVKDKYKSFSEQEKERKSVDSSKDWDILLEFEMFSFIEDVRYYEEELYALFEMKIIYAFKHLEISIKQILSVAYEDFSAKNSSNWDLIIQFLKTKNIDIRNIEEYSDINQLRLLNNSLKHSDSISDSILKSSKDFKNKNFIAFEDLERFYRRTQKAPNKFLKTLKKEILKDVYDFSEDRIISLANSFAIRMTKTDAEKFTESLLKQYD